MAGNMDAVRRFQRMRNMPGQSQTQNVKKEDSAAAAAESSPAVSTGQQATSNEAAVRRFQRMRGNQSDKNTSLLQTHGQVQDTPDYKALAQQAQKKYDDYMASNERTAAIQKYNAEHKWDGLKNALNPMGGTGFGPTAPADDMDPKERELKARVDYYRNMADQAANKAVTDADLKEISKMNDAERLALERYAAKDVTDWYSNIFRSSSDLILAPTTDSGINALISKYGQQRVKELASSYQRSKNEQITKNVTEKAADAVDGKVGASIGHSAATVGANLMGAVTAPMETIRELSNRDERYTTLDPNSMGHLAGAYSGAVRGKVAENIAGDEYDENGKLVKDGGVLRQVAALGYQGLMSSADSLARAAIGGGSKAISLGLAATGSFGQTVQEASKNGATPGQAIALGVATGGLEIATEKLPLDEILKVAGGGPVKAKQLLKNVLKQAAIEVTEEEVSFLGSLVAEAAILREKSGYNREITQNVMNGMSYQEAREQANWGLVTQALETAISSGFSGGMSAGGSSLVANVRNRADSNKTQINPNAHVELKHPAVRITKDIWDQGDRLAKATGRNVIFYEDFGTDAGTENGYFEDGVIYVNVNSDDPVAQIVSHELTHSVEFADAYKGLSRLVLNRIRNSGADLQQMRQEKIDIYARNGHPLKGQTEVDQEIVAEYVAKNLLTDEQQILEVARVDRTLAQKIRNWVDNLLSKLGNKDAAERTYLYQVRNLYSKALHQTQNNQQTTTNTGTANPFQQEQTAEAESSGPNWDKPEEVRTWAQNALRAGEITDEQFDGILDTLDQMEEEQEGRAWAEEQELPAKERKHSFAGPKAKNADLDALEEAKQMQQAGADNETIRQQTGWFTGMDGKWRWEVDDSTAKVAESLTNYMTLEELMPGAEIFNSYPDMKNISVVFQSLPRGVYAQYNRQFDHIDVNYELKDIPEAVRSAVLHEIQHAIQNREGFTAGATVNSWEKKIRAGFDSRKATDKRTAEETNRAIRETQEREPEFYRDMMELDSMTPDVPRGKVDWDTLEKITEDPPEWQAFDARREELEKKYGDTKVWDFMDLLYQQEKAAKNEGRSATDLYFDTAGEIEARDVDNRRNLTGQERKNTPPRLGDEDTVFAEGNVGWINAANDTETSSIKEQLQNKQDELQKMDPVAEMSVPENLRDRRTAYNWAVELLKPTGYRVERQGFGTIWFEKDDINYGLNYADTPEEKAALALLPRILKRGIEIGKHGNHKLRQKETITFAAPAIVNGTRVNMAAVVTVKNGRYYTHRIVLPNGKVFKFGGEKNNDAVQEPHWGVPSKGSLANATSTASSNILADSDTNVKRQMSISAPTVNKKDVAKDLRAILNRGGSAAELRQYISNLERSDTVAEQNGGTAEQTVSATDQILQNAKRLGIGVSEYLQRNWEQYDVDGEWNQAARDALEQERRSRRRYSVSEDGKQTEDTEGAEKAQSIRTSLNTKARTHLEGTERKMLAALKNKLGVSSFTNREDLQEIVREISDEYLQTGTVADEKMDFLFDRAYAGGIVKDAEFFEQYKEIKQHLRTTPVTISEYDSHNIADFGDFRRRHFGIVKIVKEGGLPVDTAYQELNGMAPELFPESITHPADQLVRMAEVAKNIHIVEKNLNDYHGDDRENFRKWARNDFETAVADTMGDLWQVKRYMEDAEATEEAAPTTPEEAAEYYRQLKTARRDYEKAAAKNLLTDTDEMQLARLLRGEILTEHLDPEKDNVKGITAVYEAKKEYERLSKLLAEYKRTVRAGYRDTADKHLETANEWKDKAAGILYSRETMERNIDDIVPDREVANAIKREYFEAVHISEAEATRFKNDYRERVKKLGLSRDIKAGNLVSEAHAVQLLGEAEDNIRVLQNARGRMKMRDGKTIQEWRSVVTELWKQSPNLDEQKIRRAVDEYRKIYDELFARMNEVRVKNGYEPVNYRQGYFPHFQPGEGDGILGAFGKALNIDTQVAALPTTINGLTHTFKPGIQWFGNAQERLGFNTCYDAVEGFDKYIEGVASVIYQTENIQKLRALATQIRYRTTEEGIRKQVDEIRARENLTEDEKQVQINSIFEHGKYTLSNFAKELDEYTNLLANKKSKLDRGVEAMLNRRIYAFMKAWENRVGANMIAGNLSSAFTNWIPLTQAGAQLDRFSLIKGMAATLQSYKEDDGIRGRSTFLTNRHGSDPLVQTWTQKASKVMGTPMELIDGFTSDSIVRAAYLQNLKRGMSEAEAMNQADIFAAHVMADRSKGALPTLFESRNPLYKAFTQFQLEVNNQFSEVFKDIPRRNREKGLAVLAAVLMKYFIGAFLYNEIYEFFVGRRPALDPFGILNDTVGDLTGYELPNLVELGINAAKGEETSFRTEKVGVDTAIMNATSTVLGELPFSSGLTLIGVETDGGRIPAASAVPDLATLVKVAFNKDWSPEKRWKEAQDELNKLSYVITPFGGNQISKIWKGIKALRQGGSYSIDAEGNELLQYPVYKDDPKDAVGNAARALLFGKSSIPEAQDWVDSGFDSLGAKQTAVYQDLLEADVKDRDAYALLRKLETAQKTESETKVMQKLRILEESDISDEGKAIVYYGLLASESEVELMDQLADEGADQGEIGKLMIDLEHANQLKGTEKKEAYKKALSKQPMTDEEKAIVVGSMLGTDMLTETGKPTEYAKFRTAISRGLSVDDYMDMYCEGANTEDFLEATDAGASATAAKEMVLTFKEMNEQAEKSDVHVADAEYWRVCLKAANNEATQISLIRQKMTDAQYQKFMRGYDLGVSPEMYVSYYEIRSKFDSDGNGSFTNAEVKEAIDSMDGKYTKEEKAVLWQMGTGSTSAKNNPYSKEAGQKYIDAKEAETAGN